MGKRRPTGDLKVGKLKPIRSMGKRTSSLGKHKLGGGF